MHTQTKQIAFLRKALFALFLSSVLLVPGAVEGKSMSWNFSGSNTLYVGYGQEKEALGRRSGSVSYSAKIYNDTTSEEIFDQASVPVGTVIRIVPTAHQSTDISWFGTGYAFDSPNGEWINDASSTGNICINRYYVGSAYSNIDIDKHYIYILLSINPPVKTVVNGGSATLTDLGSGKYRVDSAGTLTSKVTYNSTYGHFYYARDKDDDWCAFSGILKNHDGGFRYSTHTVAVPEKTIQFNLTAVDPNTPPNPPTLTGSTTGTTSTPYTFTTQASDPDNDTLKYGMDWDNNGSVDEWMSTSGFVASNTSQNFSHQWASSGSYTFKVLAQDSRGGNSPWSNLHTITIGSGGGSSCTLGSEVMINDADGFADMRGASECQANNYLAPAYGGTGMYGNYAPCNGATAGSVSANGACISRITFEPSSGPADRCVVRGHECSGGGSCNWQYKAGFDDISDFWAPANGGSLQQSCSYGWYQNTAPSCASLGISQANDGQPATSGSPAKCGLGDAYAYSNGGYLYCGKPDIMKKVGAGCALPPASCGAANNFPSSNPPTMGLCSGGTASAVTPASQPGPYTWTCSGSNNTTATCTAPYLEPAPVVDLKINGSDGPITINKNGNLNITWGNTPYAVTCTGTGNNWTGSKFTTGGNDNISATAASLYTLTCTNSQGIQASDSISVTLEPTLKICQNSCSGGIEPPSSFSLNRYDTKNLVACYNDAASCTDATGDVTTSATWSEGGGNTVSLGGSSLKTLTADNVGTESIQASYSGNTVTRSVTVTCTDSGACQRDSRSQSLCQKDTFNVTDNCGQVQNCTGEKTCDYNWKEVAP